MDEDVSTMFPFRLREEVVKLRAAIRQHRDEKGNDRCWLDDSRLYQVLPEQEGPEWKLPCKEEFLKNCEMYWKGRQPQED